MTIDRLHQTTSRSPVSTDDRRLSAVDALVTPRSVSEIASCFSSVITPFSELVLLYSWPMLARFRVVIVRGLRNHSSLVV